jgi:hypothetical protein
MFKIILIITIFVHGHANTTRHILPRSFSYFSDCDEAADTLVKRLRPRAKSTLVGGRCETIKEFES